MKLRVLAGAAVMVASLGLLDYLTGTELSFAIFYVIPVGLAAWHGGLRAGLFFSLLGAAAWHFTNQLEVTGYSNAAIPFWNTATRLAFFVIITVLLVRLRAALDETARMAQTDSLTGALNGRAFRALAEVEFTRHRRHGRPFTVVYTDLDNFKTVNDTQGHASGDEVLRVVAQELSRALRATDALARLGGDEFAMLLVETDAADAELGVDRVRQRVGAVIRARGWPVSLSMGVVTCETAPATVDEVLHLADTALYEAKRAGKNRASTTVYRVEQDEN